MNANIDGVYAVVLAAGASRRLGHPKQLLVWNEQTLLERAVANASSVFGERCLVVLGCHAESIRDTVGLEAVTVIDNPDWQEGIASSIRAGIQALPASAEAALILLCDQPLVQDGHIRALLNAWRAEPSRIVASLYQGGAGVPALFPSNYFQALLALTGDQGAKALLKKYDAECLTIEQPEAEFDIDSGEDFERLTKRR